MNLQDLAKPFPPDRISWRVGSTTKDKAKGMALAYIDARDVMGRLDQVCGPLWQAEYVPMPNGSCCCRIGIKVGDEWIWRANGALNISDRDTVDAKEMAEKGSYSDAFKRAAVLWGIGQYLYDLDSPWVELETYEKNGQVFAKGIKPSEMARLKKVLAGEKTYAPNADVDAGVKNWCDQQKAIITAAKYVSDLYKWKEGQDGPLARLAKKSVAAFDDLMAHYQSKHDAISQKEPA